MDRVHFISGAGHLDGPEARKRGGLPGGGPGLILTGKAIFDFHSEIKLARVRSIHPGVSLDDVRENTGFTHVYIPDRVSETPRPTGEELRIIRELIDPEGVLLPR